MLSEVLAVFVIGVLVGQLMKWRRFRPRLWAASALAASLLLFSMGLSIGLEKGALIQMLPEAVGVSLLIGVSAATASAAFTYLLRRRTRD
jgi:Kef-type K+ transport system membrane component KefB